jgi:hypothetical protein
MSPRSDIRGYVRNDPTNWEAWETTSMGPQSDNRGYCSPFVAIGNTPCAGSTGSTIR